jgi:4-hydroxy-3-methylbut-2-enyl diphosphate reductase
VGLTAGASAPEALIEHVIAALRAIARVEVSVLPGIEEAVQFRLPVELLRGQARRRAPSGVPESG